MSGAAQGISIVICTYNGKKNLLPTLTHIAAQKGIENFPVELIIVDNASKDGTYEYVRDTWPTLQSSISLVLLQQPIPGKAFATRMGFDNCRYSYILVCDDDNWLCDTYLQQAYNIMSADDTIGILGGKGEAVFEESKPDWFDKYENIFAVGKQYPESGDVTNKVYTLWGAGMVIKKEAWDKLLSIGYEFLLNEKRDKKGNWGGDDSELCLMIVNMGYKMWVENNMSYKHFMPQNRMNLQYLKSRFFGLGRSRLYTHVYLVCRYHKKSPQDKLKYPLWLDRWLHKTKLYLKLLPKFMFTSNDSVSDEEADFLGLKGELYELWSLKRKYNDVFTFVLNMQAKIAVLPPVK